MWSEISEGMEKMDLLVHSEKHIYSLAVLIYRLTGCRAGIVRVAVQAHYPVQPCRHSVRTSKPCRLGVRKVNVAVQAFG